MTDIGGVAGERLRSFIERIERLMEEKASIGADIREVFEEAKGVGFNTKIMRKMIVLRKLDPCARQEEEQLIELYKRALGMEGGAEPAMDTQLREAAAMFRAGLTVRVVADALDVSSATAGRLRQEAIRAGMFDPDAVSRLTETDETGTPHDPDTGEIIELDRPGGSTAAPVAEPESPDAESADAKAAPNVNAAPAAASQAVTSAANQDAAAPSRHDRTMPAVPLTPEENARLELPKFLDRRGAAAE